MIHKYNTVDGYRAVVFHDGWAWVAMCLEHDIGSQSSRLEIAIERLEKTIVEERRIINSRNIDIPPSPRKYHDMWDSTTEFYNHKICL
jgi:hypothetical protein